VTLQGVSRSSGQSRACMLTVYLFRASRMDSHRFLKHGGLPVVVEEFEQATVGAARLYGQRMDRSSTTIRQHEISRTSGVGLGPAGCRITEVLVL
ncbi:hypothetical protein BaRGS_00039234, partial [Batillaria attramentaria]